MRRALIVILAAAASTAASGAEAYPTTTPDEVPAALAPLVARADQAMEALRSRLLARLNALLAERGPAGGIEACSAEAAALAREIGAESRLELGRTSHRVRNPSNAPRAWAADQVRAAAGKRGGEVKAAVVDLGDRVGVLRPITAAPACTRCHGAPEAIDPEVRALLAKRYPQDRATGFAAGDHRGFMWAEVKKR
jgi:hypothetical protein